MTAGPDIPGAQLALVTLAGGYLRNVIREPGVTCRTCATPWTAGQYCDRCTEHLSAYPGELADLVGFMSYAVGDGPLAQSGHLMRQYKGVAGAGRLRPIVSLLASIGLQGHTRCAGVLVGMMPTHWAAVPSLAGRIGDHPLHQLVHPLARPGSELPLLPGAVGLEGARALEPGHFAVAEAVPAGSHVLLVDDTWASGGHGQSAAIALRRGGAAHVSLFTLARWLSPAFGATGRFISTRLALDYDPTICPWTGGLCPPA